MAKEYIEREAVLMGLNMLANYFGCGDEKYGVERAKQIVEMQPAADVVEVVRCKDCKHFMPFKDCGSTKGDCEKGRSGFYWLSPNDYCSYGAKMDGGNKDG